MNNSRPNRQDLNNSISSHSHSDTRASYDNSYNKGPTSAHTNGQVQKTSVKQRTSVNKMERPKSVPPTMFNQHGSSDSDQSNDYQQNHVGIKGTPPVPPPRKTKDMLSGGRYSVLREPSSPTKPMSSSNLNQGQWNNGSQSGSQVLIGQTPSSPQKIGPTPSKSSNNRPLPPKPLNSEDGEHKENSIWYEYGCV
jgi:hypothetical protein